MTGAELLIAAAVGSAAIGAVGAIQAGKAQQQAANYNAMLAEREGREAKQVAASEAREARRRGRRLISSQTAAYGAAGLDISGSALEVLADTAEITELDALNIERAGSAEEARAIGRANAERFAGKQARTASYFGAASSILSGASQIGAAKVQGQKLRTTTGGK